MISIANVTPYWQIYRHQGQPYVKISESLHQPARWVDGVWIGYDRTERLNPNELVETIQ